MGIENFFNGIIKNKIISENLLVTEKINVENLFIDFNSIVYSISDKIERDFNYVLYAIIINEIDDKCKQIFLEYNYNLNSIEEFVNYFTKEKINDIIIDNIILYIKNICKNVINSEKLKQLYIALDGIPTMSKIIEQKKRRYAGYIIDEIAKKIFDKNYDKVIKDEYYMLYRKYRLSFDRSQITSWSTIMQIIANNLSSLNFKTNLQAFCINLNSIIVSSAYEMGEGEKKIMEYILYQKLKGDIAIYTPDSDVIILSMIMYNTLCNSHVDDKLTINLLRHNQLENVIDIISINNLIKNIMNHIKNKVSHIDVNKYSKIIMNDIITIIIFLGNDFLPKIQSLYIKNSIYIVIDVYIKFLNWNRNHYKFVTFEDNYNMKINYENLVNLIKKFSENEDKLIYESYLSSTYKNYGYLSKIFEENTYSCYFLDKLNRYVHGFNKVIKYIKANINTITGIEVYDNIIKHFTDKNTWESQFIQIEGYLLADNTNIIEILNMIIVKIKDNTYKCGLKLIKYSSTIDDKFHQQFLQQNLNHPKMKINDYHIEKYKLENMLDEYKNIGNNTTINDNFGFVDVKYKNSEYKIHIDRNVDDKKNIYYNELLKCKTQNDIDNICEEYIRGFFWVYDFYFNKNNRNTNINNISTWVYEYNRTPFFTEIFSYLSIIKNKNYELNKIFLSVNNIHGEFYVKSHNFLTRIEQFIYITPKAKHYDIPDNYKNITNDEIVCPNVDNIVNEILEGKYNNIDCFNIKYLNKFKLNGILNYDINNFITKIKNYR
jgi:5'-3' exonuclease